MEDVCIFTLFLSISLMIYVLCFTKDLRRKIACLPNLYFATTILLAIKKVEVGEDEAIILILFGLVASSYLVIHSAFIRKNN
jgi:hypothetical protein